MSPTDEVQRLLTEEPPLFKNSTGGALLRKDCLCHVFNTKEGLPPPITSFEAFY